jgi:hypothetical protein
MTLPPVSLCTTGISVVAHTLESRTRRGERVSSSRAQAFTTRRRLSYLSPPAPSYPFYTSVSIIGIYQPSIRHTAQQAVLTLKMASPSSSSQVSHDPPPQEDTSKDGSTQGDSKDDSTQGDSKDDSVDFDDSISTHTSSIDDLDHFISSSLAQASPTQDTTHTHPNKRSCNASMIVSPFHQSLPCDDNMSAPFNQHDFQWDPLYVMAAAAEEVDRINDAFEDEVPSARRRSRAEFDMDRGMSDMSISTVNTNVKSNRSLITVGSFIFDSINRSIARGIGSNEDGPHYDNELIRDVYRHWGILPTQIEGSSSNSGVEFWYDGENSLQQLASTAADGQGQIHAYDLEVATLSSKMSGMLSNASDSNEVAVDRTLNQVFDMYDNNGQGVSGFIEELINGGDPDMVMEEIIRLSRRSLRTDSSKSMDDNVSLVLSDCQNGEDVESTPRRKKREKIYGALKYLHQSVAKSYERTCIQPVASLSQRQASLIGDTAAAVQKQLQQEECTVPKKRRSRPKYTPAAKVYVDEPTDFDVLYGRGASTNRHPGNRWYIEKVQQYRPRYLEVSKNDKAAVAFQLICEVQARNGRFLQKDSNGWYVAHVKAAIEKVSAALRERRDDGVLSDSQSTYVV